MIGGAVVRLALAWTLLAPGPADSLGREVLAARETAAWHLIANLQSPFCPGLTLESCPSWYADSLRTEIRQRMAAGESPEVIRDQLAREFGQRVLGEPTWQGFDLLGWVGPGVMLASVGMTLGWILRRRVRQFQATGLPSRPGSVPAGPALSVEERRTLERQLAEELRQG